MRKFSLLFCSILFSQLLPHVYFNFSTERLKCCFIVLKAITVPHLYKFFFVPTLVLQLSSARRGGWGAGEKARLRSGLHIFQCHAHDQDGTKGIHRWGQRT